MRRPRSLSSLLLILGALAMLATPVTALAAGPSKKAPVTAKKSGKVDKARSAAAKKGWETRRMNQKAEANWASRIAKNPKLDTPGAREAFMTRSVASQRGWQKRNAATPTGKNSKKVAAKTGKNSKKAAAKTGSKKVAAKTGSKTKKAAGKTSKKTSKKVAGKDQQAKAGAAAQSPESEIANANVGGADFNRAVAKFDEARFAAGQNRPEEAAEAQMEGHDAMAKAAFATADAYEKAGRVDEANKLIEFGNDHVEKANAIEVALDQMQPQRGPIRRFFSWLNPFKKRGGGEQQVRVAGE